MIRRWPQHRRKYIVIGLLISSLSLTTASFATSVWQLILTQGFLYAVGASMMSYPTMLCLDEWFVRRKGLAFGIAWAGTSFSGLVAPFFIFEHR
jgi:MFS family permease